MTYEIQPENAMNRKRYLCPKEIKETKNWFKTRTTTERKHTSVWKPVRRIRLLNWARKLVEIKPGGSPGIEKSGMSQVWFCSFQRAVPKTLLEH